MEDMDVDEAVGRCFSCTNKMETVSFDHPLFKGKICIKCKVSNGYIGMDTRSVLFEN